MQFKVRMHPSNQQWTTTLYRTTWTYWGWFLACVLWCWESNGLHGSPFTVPAFHLPTQNSTMIPSKLCQALCCQFLLLLCLICKILRPWDWLNKYSLYKYYLPIHGCYERFSYSCSRRYKLQLTLGCQIWNFVRFAKQWQIPFLMIERKNCSFLVLLIAGLGFCDFFIFF